MLAVISLLAACSTGFNRSAHDGLVSDVGKKDYAAAVKTVQGEDFYPEERSELLRLMERGTVYYRADMLPEALAEFDKAKTLSDNLYTKSISAAAASILDDNNAEFYGENFERSGIRFYQSLIHYKMGNKSAAKSVVREWNSIFADIQAKTAGRPLYKADLTEMLWGAFLNEDGDRQTALSLYRKAKDSLFKNFNIYPTYNGKYEKFAGDFSKLGATPRAKAEKDYVDATAAGRDLADFIDGKIKRLEKNERDNFAIVVKDGFVADKKSHEYKLEFNAQEMGDLAYLGAYLTAASGGSGRAVGNAAFISFATTYLLNGITFDLPYIEPKASPVFQAFLVSGGKSVEVPLVITSPMSDIAYNDINANIGKEKAGIIARMTAEYIGAAATSYFSYAAAKETAKNGAMGELLGIGAAVATFKGLGAAIQASNQADLRQWKLLPSNIRMGSASVPAGDYVLRVVSGGKTAYESKVSIGKNAAFMDVNI